MAHDKLLLTVSEAAERLGIGRSFAYQLVSRGELASLKLGRARRVPTTALDDFIAQQLSHGQATERPAVVPSRPRIHRGNYETRGADA
jgi:excisionase family DNA binding protein